MKKNKDPILAMDVGGTNCRIALIREGKIILRGNWKPIFLSVDRFDGGKALG